MKLNARLQAEIEAHALEEYPRESCGFIVSVKGKKDYIRCRNVAQGNDDFEMAVEDVTNNIRNAIAVIHSHPDKPALLSEIDRINCEHTGLPWGVVVCGQNEVLTTTWHEPCGYTPPLEGREHVEDVLDCYALVRDWYLTEKEIELPDFQRVNRFWEHGVDLIQGNLKASGFVVTDDTPQIGDVFVFRINDYPVDNHLGVYIGGSEFLHHPYRRNSRREIYSDYWRDRTTMRVRLENNPD